MKTILLNINYTNDKDFWCDSYIKNKIYTIKDNDIHKTIKDVIENDDVYMELLYRGKPQANIFIDDKEGNAKPVGYVYRAKTKIENKKAVFDVWATIKEVSDYPIELLD